MFDPASLIVGLEIGTSKICAVVGEVNAAGALNLIGLGQSRSRGVRKGEIADAPIAEEDVRNAIVEAEQMADVEIRSVYLGVTGGHIRGHGRKGGKICSRSWLYDRHQLSPASACEICRWRSRCR